MSETQIVAVPMDVVEGDVGPSVLRAEVFRQILFRDGVAEGRFKVTCNRNSAEEHVGSGKRDGGIVELKTLGGEFISEYVQLCGTGKKCQGSLAILMTLYVKGVDTLWKVFRNSVDLMYDVIVRRGVDA